MFNNVFYEWHLQNMSRNQKNFGIKLESEVDFIVNSEDKKIKEIRTSAYRVQDIIEESQRTI